MKTIVIYHKADYDGIFCREIAKKFLPGAELIGWDYNDPVPVVDPEDSLYILDLSVPELMGHPKLVWIDHHKSAIDKFNRHIRGYRIDGVAACRLTWQWFWVQSEQMANDDASLWPALPHKEDYVERLVREPWCVRLAGEYDIWDKRDPHAELFQHGLRSEDLQWDLLIDNHLGQSDAYTQLLLNQGKALQYAKQKEDASHVTHNSFTITLDGLCLLALNTCRCNSLTFLAGLKPEHDGCFAFGWTGKGWRCSLYGVPGKPDIDLSQIAIRRGGGGHKQACGFFSVTLPIEL